MANEFSDDLYDDQPTDTELVRSLRQQLREKDRKLGEVTRRLGDLETKDRETSLKDILKAKGAPEKAIGLYPKDQPATPEAIEKWLDDWADVLKIERAPEGETPQVENTPGGTPAAGQTQAAATSGAGAGGMTPEEVAAFTAVQRTEQGAQTPPLGLERMQQQMADIRSLPTEQAFQKMRELGVMSG